MAAIEIRDMQPADEYYVGTCSHRHESAEIDASSRRRVEWLKEGAGQGVRAKVARVDDRAVGFLFAMPIEHSPWGPAGRDLLVVPCLYVPQHEAAQGAGTALIEAAEQEARDQGLGGIVLVAVDREGWWFMPAGFFEGRGFTEAGRRGMERLLWKPFRDDAEAPAFLERNYVFEPTPGRVAVDLFWARFCLTSDVEAQRVRDVAGEFGDRVVVREHPACDPHVLRRTGIPRGVYVDGHEISWGYEAPRDGIRDAIRQALLDH